MNIGKRYCNNLFSAVIINFALISMPAFSQDSINIETDKIQNDPISDPIAKCYEAVFSTGMKNISSASLDDKEYKMKVLAQGGILGIAYDARDACDKWYLAKSNGSEKAQNAARAWGILFISYAMEQQESFYKSCMSQKNTIGWEHIIKVCKNLAH